MQRFAKRVKQRHDCGNYSLGEVCTGIASEGGEVVEEWRKYLYEFKPLRQGNVVNEMADVLHYLVLGCEYFGIDLEDLARVNWLKMDAIDNGERGTFDILLTDWECEREALSDRLNSVEEVLRTLYD